MKPNEFCYWLQSSFELANMNSFDQQQTKCIKKHLDMALFLEPETKLPVMNWLKALFEFYEPTMINEEQTQLIKEKLKETFINYIDKSYPNDKQKQLNDLHHGKRPNIQAMC